jgi:hypothetical protein
MSLLYVLKGKQVRVVDTANGYLSIIFDDGESGLHVFNTYSTSAASAQDMTGKVVRDIAKTEEHWRMVFQDGTYLKIGMRDCDYDGPESFIYFAGGNFYVNQ